MSFDFCESVLGRFGGEKQIHYSLEPLLRALEEAGHPEKSVKSLVIAGTNGKGSTTLWISQALRLHGYRVATYLSPHLQRLNERFLDQLQPWSDARMEQRFRESLALAEKWKLSYFEFLTLVFFMDSHATRPDFNVLEVGMGGRLDATNVTHPQGVVLTNISWDHSDYLGDSLLKILNEKMGVFRSGVPIVSGVQGPELVAALSERCKQLSSPLFLTQQLERKCLSKNWKGQEIEIATQRFWVSNPSAGTLENAVAVYAAITRWFPEISVATLEQAFRTVVNPGRMELVHEKPRVILSGDHNLAGMESMVQTLQDLGLQNLFVLCGFGPDKEANKMVELLRPLSRELLLTSVPRARGVYSQEYSTLASFEENPDKALEKLLKKMSPKDTLLITGSLYLVGHLRSKWKNEVRFEIIGAEKSDG